MKQIAAAFVNAKRAFGPALKDKTNPAFRSKYADLGACIDSVEDALLSNGIAFIQETFEDASGVTVETVFLHESGESMRCGKLHVPAAKQDPQGYGSALTYARRYSLMAACGIAPEDDDGNAGSKVPSKAANRPVATPDEEKPNSLTAQLKASLKAVSVSPMQDAGKGLSQERIAELDDFTLRLLDLKREGRIVEAIHAYYALPDNDDKLYVWKMLAAESAFRAQIKANSPHAKKETAKA